jgi:hypothetical protein
MSRQSEFFALVEAGDLSGVEVMLASDPSLVNARDGTGATPLHIAAFHA